MTFCNLSQTQKVRKRLEKSIYGKKLSSFIATSTLIAHSIKNASKEDLNRVIYTFTIGTKKNNGDKCEVSSLRIIFGFLETYVKQIKNGDIDRLIWIDL